MAVESRQPAFLSSLNKAQCRAVTSTAPTVAILAGPGSGKTHTLTSRVVWLIDSVGYRPEDVLVATFTVKTAREMKERIGKALGDGRDRKVILGTFHSIARRYLAAYGSRIGLDQKFGIADDSDSRAIIARICKRLNLGVDPPVARGWISKKKAKGTDTDKPAKRPNGTNGKLPEAGRDMEVCYEEYQSHMARSNLLDYDDLLVKCVELLQRFPSCVSNIQSVLIDEYQDTNGVQYELMKLFAQKHRRITIVGDPDQSIYGWRSAEIRNLHRLLAEYPHTDEISLEENYRSSSNILDTSLKVIQQDSSRYQKVLLPIHRRGTRPVLRKLRTSAKEADWIVSEIRRSILLTGGVMTHNDVAILLRSAALSRHIETALGKAGIAYRMVGGFKFYERAEIKVLLDYLRVIHQPDNNDALARIINVPKRGIGQETIKKLTEEAERSKLSLWSLLVKHCRGDRQAKTSITKSGEQKLSGELIRLINNVRKLLDDPAPPTPFTVVELIHHVLTHLKYQKFLEETHGEDHESRWSNVLDFINLATDFIHELDQSADDEDLPTVDGLEQARETSTLAKFLANVSLASDGQKDCEKEEKPTVTISTIHAAKGLEWPVVFVPSAYNGSIPHMRSEDIDEERRLLYVAMTRAQALLYLSCPLYGPREAEKLELSPFLTPLPSGCFASTGPSFNSDVLVEMSRILGRNTPSQEAIFKAMPPGASQEDDLFPVDPEQYQNSSGGGSYAQGERQAKRPRLYGQGGAGQEQAQWHRGYSTTMEQSESFTIGSLPGFTTASAHQTTMATAASAARPNPSVGKGPQRQEIKRGPNQGSIMGFVRTQSASSATTSIAAGGLPYNQNSARPMQKSQSYSRPGVNARPPEPAIQPALADHKLSAGRTVLPRPAQRKDDAAGSKHYAQFSSSPPRPAKPAVQAPGTVAEHVEGKENAPVASRPATTFHQTTTMGARSYGGIQKPMRPGVQGVTPIARVQKPFKPLTIKRAAQ